MAKHKYRCGDCKEVQEISRTERSRRTRPRCQACGSYRLDPATTSAEEDVKAGNAAIGTAGHPNLLSRDQGPRMQRSRKK